MRVMKIFAYIFAHYKMNQNKEVREVNLYMVCDSNYDWCCFAFDISRNMAKLSVARKFGNEYTEMRCKTLKKCVNVPFPMLVTHPDDNGYDIVKNCGYEYGTDNI